MSSATSTAGTKAKRVVRQIRGISPFTIVIDTREQRPYTFEAVPADAAEIPLDEFAVRGEAAPHYLRVATVTEKLDAGDYSAQGFESRVAIERKSKADFFGTLGQGRTRFEAELTRLAGYTFAAILVEAEWSEILTDPPEHSRMSSRSIVRSVLAWQQRYPRIHWHFWPGRDVAEVVCYRMLDRFVKERKEEV